MNVFFRPPKEDDIDQIMQIENAGFTADEAASRLAMMDRIHTINDCFIVAVNEKDCPIGYVVGPLFLNVISLTISLKVLVLINFLVATKVFLAWLSLLIIKTARLVVNYCQPLNNNVVFKIEKESH